MFGSVKLFLEALPLRWYLVKVLVLLSRILSLNAFRFNENREFELIPALHRVYKWLILLFGVPVCLVAYSTAVAMLFQIENSITANLIGINGINAFAALMCGAFVARTAAIYCFIAFHFCYRTDAIRELLNHFVRVHDQYVSLFGPGLRVNWIVWTVLSGKVCLSTIIFFIGSQSVLALIFIYAYYCIPATTSVISLTGLVVLHGLYTSSVRNLERSRTRDPVRRIEEEELLDFQCSLLNLKMQLEPYVQFFAVMELMPLMDFMLSMGYLVQVFLTKTMTLPDNLKALCIVIYPTLFAHLTNQIVEIEEQSFSEIAEPGKFLDLFHLRRIAINVAWKKDSWRALSTRKHFVLRYFNLLIVNGSLVFTFFMFSFLSGDMPESIYNADFV